MKELKSQEISDFKLWNGIYLPSIKASINKAHKQIVEWAYENDLDEVCIAEDDICFTAKGAWDYFLQQKPKDFDIYLGGIYSGDIKEDNSVDRFTGFHLYVVSKKFYPIYLSVPDDEHIDRALGGKGSYIVCNPFAAIQYEGFSSNTGKMETYGNLLEGRKLFGR